MKPHGIIYNIIEVDIIRKIIRITVLVGMAFVLTAGCFVWVATSPSTDTYDAYDSSPVIRSENIRRVMDADGNELYSVNGYGRLHVDASQLPLHTLHAFIAIEDTRFYNHDGYDLKRIAAAAVKDVITFSAREGASTITQQLAKNLWLTPEKTIERKIEELKIARSLEKLLSKNDILQMYLNALYFGNGIYGITSAAHAFFGVDVKELNIGQSAMLAGIINNPLLYDPYRHNDAAESRKKVVLRRMVDCGFIDEGEARLASIPTPLERSNVNSDIFASYALSGCEGDVVTLYDKQISRHVNSVLENKQINGTTISVIVLDADTEKLVSAACNTRADISEARRQAGSIVKPIICYAPAMEMGLLTPMTPLLDKPIGIGNYRPTNYGDIYYGWVTATESLGLSLNVPAVKLLDMVGIERAKQFAVRFGLKLTENDDGLALALGSSLQGETLMNLAKAYCKFARCDGVAVSRETAYLINRMLEKCASEGTAKVLSGINNVAAKTGTVGSKYGNTDAYCIAYNSDYVVAVWVGTDNGFLPDNITGGSLPAEICADIMKTPALRCEGFEKPETVIDIEIDSSVLDNKHKVVRADNNTPIRDRISAEFSVYNMPEARTNGDLIIGDYDNFRIVDRFTDQ